MIDNQLSFPLFLYSTHRHWNSHFCLCRSFGSFLTPQKKHIYTQLCHDPLNDSHICVVEPAQIVQKKKKMQSETNNTTTKKKAIIHIATPCRRKNIITSAWRSCSLQCMRMRIIIFLFFSYACVHMMHKIDVCHAYINICARADQLNGARRRKIAIVRAQVGECFGLYTRRDAPYIAALMLFCI